MVYIDNIKPLSKDQHLKHKQWPIKTESPRFSGFEIIVSLFGVIA